jgi:glyoxylase-like metal-dependent hydrolase (beta-lactamase superfamily II)
MHVHHVNFGAMRHIPNDPNDTSIVQCLILEDDQGMALVDTGLGLAEMQYPTELLGEQLYRGWGFYAAPRYAARVQLEQRGVNPRDIGHVVLTHADVDHAGGLVDFPDATVHLAAEELASLDAANPRYLPNQFAHGPRFKPYGASADEWMGLPSRQLDLGFDADVRLLFLPGHTLGHCAVAIETDDGWVVHSGDVYYRRDEMDDDEAPVVSQAKHACENDDLRRDSEARLKAWVDENPTVPQFSTHDVREWPVATDGVLPTAEEIAAATDPVPA